MAPISSIIRHASKVFNETEADLLSPSRKQQLCWARFAICLVAWRNGHNRTALGRALNRDRTTVLHAVRNGERLERESKLYALRLNLIELALWKEQVAEAQAGVIKFTGLVAKTT